MVPSPNSFTAQFIAMVSNPILLSILGSHVMINLKIEGEKSAQQGRSAMSTITGINFVTPTLDNEEEDDMIFGDVPEGQIQLEGITA